MAKDFSKRFYNSKAWKVTRNAYITSKYGICERCGQSNSKQVHHKKYLSETNINNPEVTLNFDNLELLCDVCHQREHNEKYSPTIEGVEFNADGDLVLNNCKKIPPPIKI